MKNANFIAIDFETANNKRYPCQLGIVVVKEGEIVERKDFLIRPPQNSYSKGCINIHGIKPEDTIDKPEFDELWHEEIEKYFAANFIVAHNLVFDLDVLHKILDYYNIPHPILMGEACTYKLYNLKLKEACEIYHVDLCNHHDGLCDAEACAKLFLNYLGGGRKDFYAKEETRIYINKENAFLKTDFSSEKDTLSFVTNKILDNFSYTEKCYFGNNIFGGAKVIISGNTNFDRDRAYDIIEYLGGFRAKTVVKSLDIAILGEDAGWRKIEQIEELRANGKDIIVLNEEEFCEKLKDILKI